MDATSLRAFRVAAGFGFVGVALGAFGAHGLQAVFALHPKAALWWETAVFYHLLHTVVMLLLACLRPFPTSAWRLFIGGVILFSGSLYLMALTRLMFLAALTPIGGLCFLAGWLMLAARPPAGVTLLPSDQK